MSSCPRCVQQMPPETVRCPQCGYVVPSASIPSIASFHDDQATAAEQPPLTTAPSVGPDQVIASDPWEDTVAIPVVPSVASRTPGPRVLLLGALVSSIVVVAAAAVFLGHHSGHSPNKANAASTTRPATKSSVPGGRRAQAVVIAAYLAQSAHARQGVAAAITAIQGCDGTSAAVTTLQSAATLRI